MTTAEKWAEEFASINNTKLDPDYDSSWAHSYGAYLAAVRRVIEWAKEHRLPAFNTGVLKDYYVDGIALEDLAALLEEEKK